MDHPDSARTEALGIVMPLANERDTIEPLLRRILPMLALQDRIFCVLDRVSTDGTRDIIDRLAAEDARIVHVYAPEDRCVVDAYFRGYREALRAGMDWILEMDGGFSHDPGHIPRFIQAMQEGAEYAGGSRFMPGGRYIGPWKRYILSRGGTILANLLLGTSMHDMTSGFECFTRRCLQDVLDAGVMSRAHFFQTEIRYHVHQHRWVEVPITYTNPSKSVGAASIREAFGNLWRLRRLSRQRRELRLAAVHAGAGPEEHA